MSVFFTKDPFFVSLVALEQLPHGRAVIGCVVDSF